jgi:hypothetical protein
MLQAYQQASAATAGLGSAAYQHVFHLQHNSAGCGYGAACMLTVGVHR